MPVECSLRPWSRPARGNLSSPALEGRESWHDYVARRADCLDQKSFCRHLSSRCGEKRSRHSWRGLHFGEAQPKKCVAESGGVPTSVTSKGSANVREYSARNGFSGGDASAQDEWKQSLRGDLGCERRARGEARVDVRRVRWSCVRAMIRPVHA